MKLIHLFTAVALILTGLIFGDKHPGPFFILVGLLAIIILFLREWGHLKTKSQKEEEKRPIDPISKFAALTYMIALSLAFLYYNIRINQDQIIFFGIFAAALVGRTGKFLSDWLPLAILIFAYDSMRGIADNVGFPIHYNELIIGEKILFLGNLPFYWLQDMFYTPGIVAFHDVLAFSLYYLHFTPTAIFLGLLWAKNEKLFPKLRDSMILVSYAALVTFLIFPAAPPWLAAKNGYIPPLHRIRAEMDESYYPATVFTIYELVTSNPVAAMPSLHAAYPFLLFIFALKYWGKKGIVTILLPLGIGISSVYLGEHYFIDILAGFLYATIAFLVIERLYTKSKINFQRISNTT